ncbi:TetR/AcrR family transcriptional regulator [Prosthecochloris sp.]|uniref:TetR/AcrR family transcriptional regulator n=1 Tax=Prosthecochloris sp. TaxID=290513 RepID=UPI0025DF9492|nr:TetR/AcrR family transcriptional regulator [Prosthecochloris sp.]
MCPKIVDKKLKRQQLVKAAVSVFSERGFKGTSMEEVSLRAGIGKGTIYEYFGSKEDLFYACFDWFMKMTIDQAAEALKECAGSEEKLRTAARVWTEVVIRYIDFCPIPLEVWAMASTGSDNERFSTSLKEMYASFRTSIEEMLREGQSSGEFRRDMDVTAIAIMLVSAFDGVLLQSLFDRSIHISSYMNSFLDVLVRGMKPDLFEG